LNEYGQSDLTKYKKFPSINFHEILSVFLSC